MTAAVENEPHACATLAANHPEVKIYQRNIQDTAGRELRAAAATKGIDLLAGCPPGQGFTSLTAKYLRTDPRNNLIHEMARLVQEIQPRAIIMENGPDWPNAARLCWTASVRISKRWSISRKWRSYRLRITAYRSIAGA